MAVGGKVRGRMGRKKTVQSSITSMGFPLLQKTGEMCGTRSTCLENSGTLTEAACVTMNQIRSLNVPCPGFMLYTSGVEVVFPLKLWNCRRWVWMDRSVQNPEDLMMTKKIS